MKIAYNYLLYNIIYILLDLQMLFTEMTCYKKIIYYTIRYRKHNKKNIKIKILKTVNKY